jgi:hypothetical protein
VSESGGEHLRVVRRDGGCFVMRAREVSRFDVVYLAHVEADDLPQPGLARVA